MAFFNDIFGGKSATQSASQTTAPAPYINKASKDIVARAGAASKRPFPDYSGERLAGFTPDELSAFDLARGNVGSWQGVFDQAVGSTGTGGGPITAADIDRYMNPWNDSVVDAVSADLGRLYGRQRVQDNATLSSRGSFGNDRTGVLDSLRNESEARTFASTIAPLRARGFDTALSAASSDRDRALAAAKLYGSLAPLISTLGASDVSNLESVGAIQRALKQAGLDISYEDFLREFYYPQEQLGWETGIVGSVPHPTTTTSTQQVPVANPLVETLGGIASGVGSIGDTWKAFQTPAPGSSSKDDALRMMSYALMLA